MNAGNTLKIKANIKEISKNVDTLNNCFKNFKKVLEEVLEVENIKRKANKDIFGYCEGCNPDICLNACSEENNFNLPF